MGTIIKFRRGHRHGRASSGRAARTSKVISDRPRLSAARATVSQCSGGMPRDLQLLTADGPTPQMRATSPVPPSRSITEAAIVSAIAADDNSPPVNLSSAHEWAGDDGPADCLNFTMPTDLDEIARRLRLFQLAQIELGNSQAAIAHSIAIKDNRWSQYLSGKRPLTLDIARRLYAVHDIPHDWIWENNPKSLDLKLRQAILRISKSNPAAEIVNIRGRKPTKRKISPHVKKTA